MNIFATNVCPIISAQELCDQHVRAKMPVESAILLQHCFDNFTLQSAPKTKKDEFRKSGKGYFNHPSAVWVRESKENFKWLVEHSLEMFTERDFRWPNSPKHFTKDFIEWCEENVDKAKSFTKQGLTPFSVAINENSKCRDISNFANLFTTKKYQLYIRYDKNFATWTKRQKPSWMEN